MTILNKALTRPAALWGSRLSPAVHPVHPYPGGRLVTFLLASPASHTCLYRAETAGKEDIHFFDLKLLAFKTRGNRAATRHFGTKALVANQYDAIDVTEFIKHMRLNESIPLSRYLPGLPTCTSRW
ncbi:hypothetical protein ACFSKS_26200 [Pseudocitrobacter faecalis]